MKVSKKASKAVVRQRVEHIMKIRLLGAEFHDIRQFAAEEDEATGRPWKVGDRLVSDRQLWRYIQAADVLLEKYLEKDKQKLFNRHIGIRRSLFSRAVESGDLKAALAIAQDECRLYGLYPEKRDGKAHVQVNLFQRIGEIHEQLINANQPARLDNRVEAGHVPGECNGERLDQEQAHPEANGLSGTS